MPGASKATRRLPPKLKAWGWGEDGEPGIQRNLRLATHTHLFLQLAPGRSRLAPRSLAPTRVKVPFVTLPATRAPRERVTGLRKAHTHLVSGAQSPPEIVSRSAPRIISPRLRGRSQGRSLPRSPPAPPAFRSLAWRAASEAPRRRQAEPIGASGQLPPHPRASLLLLLKDRPERVYVEPCKLPARDFAISQEIRTCACKRGHGAAGPTKRISS